jgi:hypothetical protein
VAVRSPLASWSWSWSQEDDWSGMNAPTTSDDAMMDYSTIEFVPLMSSTSLSSSSSSSSMSPTPPPSAKARLFSATDDYHFTPESSPTTSPTPIRRARAATADLDSPIVL